MVYPLLINGDWSLPTTVGTDFYPTALSLALPLLRSPDHRHAPWQPGVPCWWLGSTLELFWDDSRGSYPGVHISCSVHHRSQSFTSWVKTVPSGYVIILDVLLFDIERITTTMAGLIRNEGTSRAAKYQQIQIVWVGPKPTCLQYLRSLRTLRDAFTVVGD